MNYRDNAEIDLMDLLHYLLLKWRAFIVFILIGTIAMGIYGHYRKVPMVIDEQVTVVDHVDENSLAVLSDKLNGYEIDEVVQAVETYLSYEKTYTKRKEFEDRSINMQCDPYKVSNCVTIYKISDFTNENVPDESTLTNVDNIVMLYRNALVDQSMIADIKNANNWEYDDGFVKELLSISKTGLDVMTIACNAPTQRECENVMSVLEKGVSSATPFVQNQYEHKIEKVQESYYESFSSGILDQQKNQNDNLISIEKAMQQISSAMTADQKAFYSALLNEVKDKIAEGEENVDVMSFAKQEYEKLSFQETMGTSNALTISDEATQSEQNLVMVSSNSLNYKYLAIGALGSIFILGCLYCLIYILSPKLRSKDDMRDAFGLTILGELKDENRYTKLFSTVDRCIDSFFEKKDDKISMSKRIDLIAAAIHLDIINSHANRVYVTSTCNRGDIKEILVSHIEKGNANDNRFTILSGDTPFLSPEALKNMSSSDAVVLVEEVAISRYEDIARTLEFCNRFGVKVMGAVVLY